MFTALLLGCLASHAQHSIIATRIETWTSSLPASPDENLHSAYLFLVNPAMLARVFSGEDLERGEKREAGVRKGDYPRYMYLAAGVRHPLDPSASLTIPLMVHDTRDAALSSRILAYGGRVLENIPDEELRKGDIAARMVFESIKSNESREFWEKTARISADLGRTANNLLSLSLAGPFTALTRQIMPQVDRGLRSLEKMDDPVRMVSEFYVPLLTAQTSSSYREKWVSASLYRIHWDVETPPKSRFFQHLQPVRAEDFQAKIPRTAAPYLLVLQSRSEYGADHSALTLSSAYLQRKSSDLKHIRDPQKKEVEGEFLAALSLTLDVKRHLDAFQQANLSRHPNRLALARAVDAHYQRSMTIQAAMHRLNFLDGGLREKYRTLYVQLQTESDLWFQGEILTLCRDVARLLSGALPNPAPKARSAESQYADIERLDFYFKQLEGARINGLLPSEVEALPSFRRAGLLRAEWERDFAQIVFSREASDPKPLPLDEGIALIEQRYPACASCPQWLETQAWFDEKKVVDSLYSQFAAFAKGWYPVLSCLDQTISYLDQLLALSEGDDTITGSVQEVLTRDRNDLRCLTGAFQQQVNTDLLKLVEKERAALLRRWETDWRKAARITTRLQQADFSSKFPPCPGSPF